MAPEPDTIDPLFKLRNSPLQGVEAYRSPFYRRLLSAGYKGYIQGSLGGATLFALLGAGAGAVVAGIASAFIAPAAAFIAVPIMSAGGLLYGKDAFGTIGAVAAISAEQAELSEKRRSLLDRYFETPSREEAKEIETQLREQGEEKSPRQWFHWKAAILGALVVGAAAALIICLPSITQGALTLLQNTDIIAPEIAKNFLHFKIMGVELHSAAQLATPAIIAGAAGVGAIFGSLIGIDRAYIRKWFDVQERFHDESDVKSRRIQHQQTVERLQQAYRGEGFGMASRGIPSDITAHDQSSRTQPISPRTVAMTAQPVGNLEVIADNPDKPKMVINAADAELQHRLDSSRQIPLAAL